MTSTTTASTLGQTRRPSSPQLRGDIEGLRAIAVLMVLLYHAGVPGFSGGFAGVDVFFVISGFLITSLLVKEAQREGRVSLTRFYARRARRLLPAASLVIVVTVCAGAWLLPRGRHAELAVDGLGSTGYVVNWVLAAREVDYLAEDARPSLLQHYWSLSVEEQFYVVWPVLIIAVLWAVRRWRLRLVPVLSLALLLVLASSLAWSVLLTAAEPGRAYFVTTTRVWELGIGALLVLLRPRLQRLPRPVAAGLAWLGLGLIALTVVAVSSATPWPGRAALLPTVGTALVIAAGLAWLDSPPARLLGVAPMRFLGGLSYGLYLWHWPALQLLEELRPGSGLLARLVVALLSIALAWASLRLVEDPIRFHPVLATSTRRALAVGLAMMLTSATVSGALLASAPRLSAAEPEVAAPVAGGVEPVGPGALALVDPTALEQGEVALVDDQGVALAVVDEVRPDPAVATEDISVAYAAGCQVTSSATELRAGREGCVFGDPQGGTTVALVGDSKMEQWSSALDAIGAQEGWRILVYTRSACRFTTAEDDECVAYNQDVIDALVAPGSEADVVLLSQGGAGDSLGDEEGRGSEALLQSLLDAGSEVVLLADTAHPRPEGLSGSTVYECLELHPDDYDPCRYPWTTTPGSTGNPPLTAVAQRLELPLVDLTDWICPPDRREHCPPVVGGVAVHRQGSHLTSTYVRSLTPLLHHALAEHGVARTPPDQIRWQIAPARG